MSFFSRPYLLIWRDNAWLALSKRQYFQQQQTADRSQSALPESSLDEALHQLASLLRQRKRKPTAVLLPDAWVELSESAFDAELPQPLHFLVAQTQAGQMFVRESSVQMISYMAKRTPSTVMHVATLPKTYFDAFAQLGISRLYSEGLVLRNNLSSWRSLSYLMRPFASYEEDYLERQTERRHRNTLAILIALVALSSSWFAMDLVKHTPEPVADFQWPWPSNDKSRMDVISSLTYLRTLPATLRLDDVRISLEHIHLSVTGNAEDLQLWQANWPKQLPPLQIMLNGQGPI